MSDDERRMRAAIEAAKKSSPEDGRAHPRVGVVVARVGKEDVTAFRGQLKAGEHAEFTTLEKFLSDEVLTGATVFTTLEPCTSRNHPKLPCAERLIERKVERVVIGMLDPNPNISGRSFRRLRDANIRVDMFPSHLMAEVEEMNRDFMREQKRQGEVPAIDDAMIGRNRERSLDDWYKALNRVYWNQNFLKDPSSIFAHLVGVVGGLSSLASNKRKSGIEPEGHIAKAFSWWMALCGKVGVRSVEDMLWDKFPRV